MKKLLPVLLIIALSMTMIACTAPAQTNEVINNTTLEATAVAEQPTTPPVAPSEEPTAEAFDITYKDGLSYEDSIGTVWLQGIAEISNTGTVALYLSSGNMDFEDGNGKLLAAETMVPVYPDIIQPGEKAYMYCETTYDGENPESINVLPRLTAEKSKNESIRLALTDIELSDDTYGGLKMIGRVENTTPEVASLVYIVAVLFNADSKPIGVLVTILTEDLQPADKIGFEINSFALPSEITAETVSNYIVYAYPLQMQF